MAHTVQKAGPVLISVDDGVSGLTELGYSANGIQTTFEGFHDNVPGDQRGGEAGPPIDVQYFGSIARVRLELTDWDKDTAQFLENRVSDVIADGTFPVDTAVGKFMLADTQKIRLVLDAQNVAFDRNFPTCIVRGAVEINIGSRYSRFICELEAHADAAGLLWNTTVAGP